MNQWLISKKLTVKESTYTRYESIIENHISPCLGRYPIDQISTELIESFVSNKLTNGRLDGLGALSSKTVNDIFIVLKEVFKFARSNNVHTICSFDKISFKKKYRQMRVFSVNEQKRLVKTLNNNFNRYKMGVCLCLYAGIRIGELCVLTWGNVSFED